MVAHAIPDTNKAQAGIDSLPHPGQAELYFCRLQNVILKAVKIGGDYSLLDSATVQMIQDIAASPYPASWPAKAILEFSFGEQVEYIPEPIPLPTQQRVTETQDSAIVAPRKSHLIAYYPNPTNGKVRFDLYLIDESGSYTLKVYSLLTGEMVYERVIEGSGEVAIEVDLECLSSGVYPFMVNGNGEILGTGKIVRIE